MDLQPRDVLRVALTLDLGSTVVGSAAAGSEDVPDGPTLNRFATTATGAEITGLFVTHDGRPFFNVQDPDSENDAPLDRATVGGLSGLSVTDLPTMPGCLPAESRIPNSSGPRSPSVPIAHQDPVRIASRWR